jgi:hypothetical protein
MNRPNRPNIYNNLLKEKEADSEAGAMSETVKTSSTSNWHSLHNHGKISERGIVKGKRRFDAGKSMKLNPAMAKLGYSLPVVLAGH